MTRFLCLLPALLAASTIARAQNPAPPAAAAPAALAAVTRAQLIPYAASEAAKTWLKLQAQAPDLTSRELFSAALAWAEARQFPERIEPLLRAAAAMQDRDKSSRGYGNFRWSLKDASVLDFNAVDFCMQSGALLWLRHRDSLLPGARHALQEILDLAVEGSIKHRVRSSYTNIALMNAANLLLLGESLQRPEVAREGQQRLDSIVLGIWESGVGEYLSSTYYGVDMEVLGILEAFVRSPRAQSQARALWSLFSSDIAANWFGAAQKLSGPRSREYDFLRGLGNSDRFGERAGWMSNAKPSGGTNTVFWALHRLEPGAPLPGVPPQVLAGLAATPRTVRARWSSEDWSVRTNRIHPDVSLGSAGANYANMDVPLAADLPGPRNAPRAYFLADGRGDPYGQSKIAESGAHDKALHLKPFWTATQSEDEALALCLYRDKDIPEFCKTLQSHWVMPLALGDEMWLDGERVDERLRVAKARIAVRAGQSVVLRRGSAAVAIGLLWARDCLGYDAQAEMVNDGNKFGVVRLTIDHALSKRAERAAASLPYLGSIPGVALQARIASGLDDAAFTKWRRGLADSRAQVLLREGDDIELRARGLRILALSSFSGAGRVSLSPTPTQAILEVNGRDVGRDILRQIEPIKSWQSTLDRLPLVEAKVGGTRWSAANAALLAPMEIGRQGAQSWVWMPGAPGDKGGADGRAMWKVRLPRAGKYFLWGRVLSPTPSDDSFFVEWAQNGRTLGPQLQWNLDTNTDWTWKKLGPDGAYGVDLPAGEVVLTLRPREDGARVSDLFLAQDKDAQP